MIYVTEAHYVDDYKIYIAFNDDRKGVVDLKEIITKDSRPIFQELIDIEKFKRFILQADTVSWENGLDLAPEFLYEQLEKNC